MARKSINLAAAVLRVAEARRIVHNQRLLIAKLKIAGRPLGDAEASLLSYASSLRHLEEHMQKLKGDDKLKRSQRKKQRVPR
jgi:hypothetical protein